MLIKADHFEAWLGGKDPTRSDARTPASALLKKIVDAVRIHVGSRQDPYTLTKRQLLPLMAGVLAEQSFVLSERRFDDEVWQLLKPNSTGRPGRPNAESRSRAKVDEANLKELIRGVLRAQPLKSHTNDVGLGPLSR